MPFPFVKFAAFLSHRKQFIQIEDTELYKRARVQLHWKGIVLRDEVEGALIKTKDQQIARQGDLLVAEIDAKVGGVGIVPPELDGAIVSSHYFLFEIDESKCIRPWLEWFVRSGGLADQVAARGSTNYAAIRPHHVSDFELPLPTTDEQCRIVSRIDELSAKTEEAKELRRLAVSETRALRTALVSHVVGPDQAKGQLGDVLLNKPRNGWSARCNNVETGVSVLSLGAVTGFEYRATESKRTTEPTSPDAHYWLKEGDLLITRSNAPELVGHAAIYDGSPAPCIYPDLMMRLAVNEDLADSRFVHRWLMSRTAREYIQKKAKGTSPTMKKISQGIVMSIPFPTSLDVSEQRRVVDYLDYLQAKIGALKKLQSETAAELDALMPSILSKAFRGEL